MGRPTRFSPAEIRRYYDRHTSAFVRFGQGGGSMHRAVWGPGVSTRDGAFHDVDDRIAGLARGLGSRDLHLVDLGCGVGGSLAYLAGRLPMRGTGITLSPAQVRVARERFAAAGLSNRLACVEGDYCRLPAGIPPADLAYAIESFVHAADAGRFFAECRRLVRPGGLLVICDDVRRDDDTAAARRAIGQFQRGWHVNTLIRRRDLIALSAAEGFAHDSTMDLTPFLELHRLRDRLIAALLPLGRWLGVDAGRLDYLVGGHALQTCLARGWVGYELTVFRRGGA